jgi:copper chaperone
MPTLKFDVNGMTCGGCSDSVQRALTKIDGVSQVDVSLQSGIVSMEVDPVRVTSALIKIVIANLGYEAQIHMSDATEGKKS